MSNINTGNSSNINYDSFSNSNINNTNNLNTSSNIKKYSENPIQNIENVLNRNTNATEIMDFTQFDSIAEVKQSSEISLSDIKKELSNWIYPNSNILTEENYHMIINHLEEEIKEKQSSIENIMEKVHEYEKSIRIKISSENLIDAGLVLKNDFATKQTTSNLLNNPELFYKITGITTEEFYKIKEEIMMSNLTIKECQNEITLSKYEKIKNTQSYKEFNCELKFEHFLLNYDISKKQFDEMTETEKKMVMYLESLENAESRVKQYLKDMNDEFNKRIAKKNCEQEISKIRLYKNIEDIPEYKITNKLTENNSNYKILEKVRVNITSPELYKNQYSWIKDMYPNIEFPTPEKFAKDYRLAQEMVFEENKNVLSGKDKSLLSVFDTGLKDGTRNFFEGIEKNLNSDGKLSVEQYEQLYYLEVLEQNKEYFSNFYNVGKETGKALPGIVTTSILTMIQPSLVMLDSSSAKGIINIGTKLNTLGYTVSEFGDTVDEKIMEGYDKDIAILYGLTKAGSKSLITTIFNQIPENNIKILTDIEELSIEETKNLTNNLVNQELENIFFDESINIEEIYNDIGSPTTKKISSQITKEIVNKGITDNKIVTPIIEKPINSVINKMLD